MRIHSVSTRRSSFACRAAMLIEVATATVIMGALMMAFAETVHVFNERRALLEARVQGMLAAESVIERLRSAEPWSAAEFAAAYPDMMYRIDRAPGAGDWRELDRITITVSGHTRFGREFNVALSGYLPAEARP